MIRFAMALVVLAIVVIIARVIIFLIGRD